MHTILSHGCSTLERGFGLRRFGFAAAFLLSGMLLADTVRAQDEYMRAGRDVVRAWTLNRIAVIQAARGDIDDAKNTVAQINDPDVICRAGDVTGVCFCNGLPLYDQRPAPAGWSRSELAGSQIFPYRGWAVSRVPTVAPAGLPANYLADDARHGAVVNFSDEYDSYGTRVTSRRYADGYAVIETPRAEKNGR